MLTSPIHVLSYEELPFNSQPSEAIFSYRLTPEELISHEIKILDYFLHTPSFACILLDLRNCKTLTEDTLQVLSRRLCLISFTGNYFKPNNIPVLGILRNRNTDTGRFNYTVSGIRHALLNQGFDSVHILQYDESDPTAPGQTCFYISDERINQVENDFKKFVFTTFLNHSSIPPFLFFNGKSYADSEILRSRFVNAETVFASENPEIYALLLQINSLQHKEEKLVLENNRIKFEFVNSESYRKQLKTESNYLIEWHQKEIIKIRDFYHSQYETLPLWYKRAGHFLRILLGRNSKKDKN